MATAFNHGRQACGQDAENHQACEQAAEKIIATNFSVAIFDSFNLWRTPFHRLRACG